MVSCDRPRHAPRGEAVCADHNEKNRISRLLLSQTRVLTLYRQLSSGERFTPLGCSCVTVRLRGARVRVPRHAHRERVDAICLHVPVVCVCVCVPALMCGGGKCGGGGGAPHAARPTSMLHARPARVHGLTVCAAHRMLSGGSLEAMASRVSWRSSSSVLSVVWIGGWKWISRSLPLGP